MYKMFPRVFIIIHVLVSTIIAISANESDRLALLDFKSLITADPLGGLRSWNESVDYCQWHGVTCSHRHPHKVVVLKLDSQKLEGTVSPYIGNLSFLRELNLTNNKFHGPIPQDIGRLFRLQTLALDQNLFEGEIPTNLTHCSNLIMIDLDDNNLSGGIPVELTSLSKLSSLLLGKNDLKGSIPPSLGNLSALTTLSLSNASLTGNIPDDLCRSHNLVSIGLSSNELTGMVPACIFNLSRISTFFVTGNLLDGSLPSDIGLTLPNLRELKLGLNRFGGLIPSSLSKASKLEVLGLSENQFVGQVPKDLGRLHGLQVLNVFSNQLGSPSGNDLDFITSLTNCSSLTKLAIAGNSFEGLIPNSIANLSATLTYLHLGNNHIHGNIPPGIENLIGLSVLHFNDNDLMGEIPANINMLTKMHSLWFCGNQFSGEIPNSFGNISLLSSVDLSRNKFRGKIPLSLANCENLFELDLSGNRLTGNIPEQVIGRFSIMVNLGLSYNAFTGSLPSEIGNLTSLVTFSISSNRLSGHIPNTLSKCLMLVTLDMADNLFDGEIPYSLSTLTGITKLNLSHNKLSGKVPDFLVNFTHLIYLDLAYNELEGPVPKDGLFANVSAISIVGNSKLCGGITGMKLLPCYLQTTQKKEKSITPFILILVVVTSLCFLVLLCLLFFYYQRRRSKEEPFSPSLEHRYPRISYAELLKATNSFSTDNLIGVGSYGSVYRGVLDQLNTVVAVKVFNLEQRGGSKSFLAECNALRNLRHRNLLQIMTSCSSMDYQGNSFKALVFQFMPHGSLEEWLHPTRYKQDELRNLSFLQRLNTCIDVASALDYLHHHCQPAIVHCDLKPSNILFDDNMTAHVADFGLAKCFTGSYTSSKSPESSLAFEGSIGYIPPEYGMGGDASVQGDVYSYGILLLEMFTGKKPTDNMFQEGQCLHTFAKTALPDHIMNIVDGRILVEDTNEDVHNAKKGDRKNGMQSCLISTIKLGVACSSELPIERLNMGEVLTKLYHIRNYHQGVTFHLE